MNHVLFPQPIGIDGYQTILGSCSDSEALRVSNGNLVRSYRVANIPTVGPNLRFELTHNSRDSFLGSAGRNWRHNGMASLTITGSPPNLITYTDEQGRTYDFVLSSGQWKLDSSLFLRMTLSQVGSNWHLQGMAGGDTLIFNSTGVLQQIVDSHSQALTFNYTSGVLTSISEPTGRSLTLTYTSGLLTKITDPRNQETTLSYDANSNLTSIVGPEGCQLTYGYAAGSTHGLILSRTDALNHTYSYTFNGDGSLATITNPASKTLSYAYDSVQELSNPPHSGATYATYARTRLTDAHNQVWDYRFDLAGNLWRILDPLNHNKHLYWSDQQRLLYLSEGYTGTAVSGTDPGPYDNPSNRYTRNIFDSLGNHTAAVDANGIVTQMEYDTDSKLVAVTPARASLAVGGEWFEHFGKDGFLMCSALDTSSDLWQRPSYVDSSGIQPGESDGSNAFARALPDLPNHRLDTRAPWIRVPGNPVRNSYRRTLGQWKSQGSNASFTFRIPISQTGSFNLSFYTHCADQAYDGDNQDSWERIHAGSLGRDVEILVTDIDPLTGQGRRQKFRMPNTAAGVWITFGVYATASSSIRVKVRSRVINTDQFPVINCIAFDPIENRRTTLSYTGSDLTKVLNPLGQSTLMEYNTDGTLKKVTDAKSRDTLFYYLDTYKNLTKIVDAKAGETLLTYDANGNVLTSQDPDLRTTTMEYDGKNRLVKVKDPLNHETLFTFDAAGNLIKVKDAKLRETQFFYNSLNRLIKIQDALQQETLMEYDFTGRLTRLTDPLSRETVFSYDAAGRRIQTQLADGEKILYALNAVNRLVAITSPNASRSNWADIDLEGAVNVLDNPGMEVESLNSNTSNAPQSWIHSDYYLGNDKVRSSAEAHTGSYSLDVETGKHWRQENIPSYAGGRYLARAWAKKGAGGASTVTASIQGFVRNFQGAQESQTDASQATSIPNSWTELKPQVIQVPGDTQATRTLPPLARLELKCEKTAPADAASTAYFDDASLYLLNTCLEYDGENLREVATPDGARFRRDFDRVGRLSTLTDPLGRGVHFEYDGLDRVVKVKDSLGNSLSYSYDATGQLVSFTDARSKVTSFEFDELDRLKKITYPDSSTELFTYSAAGDLTAYTDNKSVQRTFSYDNAHRLTQVGYPGSQTLILAYDEVGNLTQRTERNGDVEAYTYDSLDRPTRVVLTPGGGSSSRAADLTSEYDAVGNRKKLGPTSASAVYGTATYGSSRYKSPAHYWSVPSNGFDAMNRMTSFQDSAGNSTALTYDGEGRRITQTPPNNVITTARYDLVGKLLSLRTVKDGNELLNLRYGYNLSSDRLALQTEKASYTYHLDRAGRLVQETTNRWVTQHAEHLAQGEMDGCLLDSAQSRVQLVGVADDFSQLHLDRWKPVFREKNPNSGGYSYYVQPHATGAQMRADKGLHLIYPSAWTPNAYHPYSAAPSLDGNPTMTLRDPVGYLNLEVIQDLELRRMLKGDFDLVLEWEGFDLASPADNAPDLFRYPGYSALTFGVERSDGSSLCYLRRGFSRSTAYTPYKNFYNWGYNGGSPSYASTTDASGKFRLKRQGSAFEIYTWNGSSWSLCGSGMGSGYTTDDLRLFVRANTGKGSLHYRVVCLTHNGGTPADFSTHAATYTSSLYDAGQSVQWSRLSWEETLPTNTDVQFQVAISNSPDGPWTYRGPDSTSGTYFTTPAGENLPNNSNFTGRYARFQARLSSSDGLSTPSFGNVHLSFTGSGMLASSCRNFVYDAAGNIQTVTTLSDSGTAVDDRNPSGNPINDLNQIKGRTVGGATWTYSYDLNGNLTGKTDGTNTFTYTWSDENRLTRVQGPGGLDVTYSYDSIGRMMSRTSGGVTTTFVWDGWDCVREVSPGADCIYHIPDGVLHSFSLNGTVYQLHTDALGSVRMVTDSSGAVVARFEYGAWGEEIFSSVDSALTGFAYRFVGGLGVRTDAATGLVYMRNRWYDPSSMRFVSRDPIGLSGGANLYAYVENSPLDDIDPWGLQPNTPQVYLELVEVYKNLRSKNCKSFIQFLHLVANRSSNVEEFMRLSQALFVPNNSFPHGVGPIKPFENIDYQLREKFADSNGNVSEVPFITRFPDGDWAPRHRDSYRHADPIHHVVDQTHHLAFFMLAGYRVGNNNLSMKLMIDAENRSQEGGRPNRGDIVLGFLGLKYGEDLRQLRMEQLTPSREKQRLHEIIERLRKRICECR